MKIESQKRPPTPLESAVQRADAAEAERLLSGGADPTEGLIAAIAAASLPMAKLMLERGAQLVPKPPCPSCLHVAVMKGSLDMIELMLAHGADVNVRFINMTPLQFCICIWTQSDTEAAKVRVLEYLISRGADINCTNDLGATPLDDALIGKKPLLAALLRRHGAQATPMSLAEQMGTTPDQLLDRLRQHRRN